MNILGHPYVAFKATGRLNKYLAAGSWLPDLVPFVPSSVFTFEGIHEGGEKLLYFLEKKYFHTCDLAFGMMAHSVRFGADKFNREIETWLLGDDEELKKGLSLEIVDCSGVSLEVARKWRVHNYLWSGIDLHLLRTETKFVERLAKAHREIDREEIANLLAACFKKEKKEVKRMIDYLFSFDSELLVSLPGLVKVWKKVLAGLPEEDKIDEQKTARLMEDIYRRFKNRWGDILERVIRDVKQKLEPYF